MNANAAIQALRVFLPQAQAVLDLNAVLESLVKVEGHRDEVKAAIVTLQAEVAKAQAAVTQAEVEAVRICSEAKKKADAVYADAAEKAASVLSASQMRRAQDESEAAKRLDDLHSVQTKLEADKAALTGEVAGLTATRDALKAEVQGLKERLASIVS